MGFTFQLPTVTTLFDSQQQWFTLSALGCAYLVIVQLLRFQRLRTSNEKSKYPTRESYAKMTDLDAWNIQRTMAILEFPFIFYKSVQFALFKTYGIPTISSLLVKTSELSASPTSMKRYADTAVLINEFLSNPPSSPRAHEGIARMNYLHHNYRQAGKILDDDMLYTLSLFALEPARWIDRYEWRQVSALEKCALGTFWKSVGDAMLISYDALPSYKTGFQDGLQWLEELDAWSKAYEAKNMVPDKCNQITADETVTLLLWDAPSFAKPLAKKGVYFLMEDRLRIAMMYERPGWIYRFIFSSILAIRKIVIRHLALPRPYFLRMVRTSENHDEPAPHHLTLWDGAPYYVKPTLWNRWGPNAWYSWIRGQPIPGDDGDKYFPKGFNPPDVGPKIFIGKGQNHFEQTKERLQRERRGQCPFSVFK